MYFIARKNSADISMNIVFQLGFGKIISVEKTDIEGYLEVRLEGIEPLFISKDGKYLISGDIFEITDKGLINKSEASIKESVRLAEYIMGAMGLSFILFPKYYLFIFTDDPEILRMGIFGLRMIGAVQFLDAIGFVLWFALSGAGNTLFPAVVESCLTWCIIVLGSYVFGVVLGLGFKALWLLFPIYMGLFAGIMIWKIRKGDWKNIQI